MRVYIPNTIKEEDLSYPTELLFIIPFIESNVYEAIITNARWWNEGVFSKLFFNKTHLIKTDIVNCDVVCLPFKYSVNDERIIQVCNEAQTYNKKVLALYNDDISDSFDLPDNLILFRTSAFKSSLKTNERIFPVLIADRATRECIDTTFTNKQSISFCGHQEGIRGRIINKIINTVGKKNCDFIIRQGYYYSTSYVNATTKRDYYSNIANSRFVLCIRGAGNFSYRFYEALNMGRIPILIDTDIELPFERIIDWSKFIIKIKEDQIDQLPNLINSCIITPQSVRQLWEKYFSPDGYISNFCYELR